jgi:hypothetical protein
LERFFLMMTIVPASIGAIILVLARPLRRLLAQPYPAEQGDDR